MGPSHSLTGIRVPAGHSGSVLLTLCKLCFNLKLAKTKCRVCNKKSPLGLILKWVNGPDRRDRGPLPGVLSLLRDHKCCPSQSSYRLETHTGRERGDKTEKSESENLPAPRHLRYGRGWALLPGYLARHHSGCFSEDVWK